MIMIMIMILIIIVERVTSSQRKQKNRTYK